MIEEKNDEGLVDYAITFLRSWLAGFRAKKNLSPPLNQQVMGLRCQSEKSLSGLLPMHYHQQSDCSNAEEGIGGGFGDCSHNKSFLNVISILGAGIVECYY